LNFLQVKNRANKTIQLPTGSDFKRDFGQKQGSKAAETASSYHYKRYLADQGLTTKDVIRALGYDPSEIGKISTRELLENDGTKPLFNAIVESGLRQGWERGSNWQALVASSVNSDQLSQQYYYLDADDADDYELRDVGQGAPIPVGTIKLGDNSIKMSKRGRGIEWTDEAKRANIDMVRLWLGKLGRQLGRQYENVAVQRLLNGYFPTGEDAPRSLGIATAGDLSLSDIFYGSAFMEQEMGFSPKIAIMNLETAYRITTLRDGDAYIYRNELQNGQFADVVNSPPFISSQVPDNRIVLVDTDYALVRYEGKPFGVESERSAKTQVEGSYGTEISEFVTFEKDARLVLTLDTAR